MSGKVKKYSWTEYAFILFPDRSGPLGVKMKVSGAGYVGSICLSSGCLSLWFKVSEVLESLV